MSKPDTWLDGGSSRMRLGIDASNIRSGGGITHLAQFLAAANPLIYGFDAVIIWASQLTLDGVEDRSWLLKRHDPVMESHYLRRALWQRARLGQLARAEGCDLLFSPGGAFATEFRPIVTMSRNLLPFEWNELWRYGWSQTTLRLLLLRWSQSRSFKRANGTVFLTEYAKNAVRKVTGSLNCETRVIAHGINKCFFQSPRRQRPIAKYSRASPFRILYVSIIDLYKHQWHVAEAVTQLRNMGLPVSLVLIGPGYRPALTRLKNVMSRLDPRGEFLHYVASVPHDELPAHYSEADLCIFASSCENLPNILLEGMASGLPIASSNRGPMPELLGDAGVYFDPEKPASIAKALSQLIDSPELRLQYARAAFERAQQYSWKRCANETLAFLANISSASGRLPAKRQ